MDHTIILQVGKRRKAFSFLPMQAFVDYHPSLERAHLIYDLGVLEYSRVNLTGLYVHVTNDVTGTARLLSYNCRTFAPLSHFNFNDFEDAVPILIKCSNYRATG